MSFNLYVGVVQGENNKKKYYSKSGTQGNGKTMCVVRNCVRGWIGGAWVFTNFNTVIPGMNRPFSYVMNLHDIIDFIEERRDYIVENEIQVVIGLMEMWSIIQFYNDPKKQDHYAKFTNQLRKMNIDLTAIHNEACTFPPALGTT
jgi:hypothetical protein